MVQQLGVGDDGLTKSEFNTHFKSIMSGVAMSGVVAVLFRYYAWTVAPPVGGEMWPYIRAGVAILAAFVGVPFGALFGYISAVIGMAIGTRLA